MWVPRELENLAPGLRVTTRIEDALEGADVVMVLRVQTERIHEPALAAEEYILGYQLTAQRLRLARPDALVLHPGPMIRGLEIDPVVADGAAVRRPRASHQRPRRANGPSLSSDRRRARRRAPSRKGPLECF